MKKFKIVLWVILIALMIMVFFQNKAFLIGKQAMMIDFFVIDEMQSPPLPIAIWFLVALVIGFLLCCFFALIERFKTKRLIKEMKTKIQKQDQIISQLRPGPTSGPSFHPNEVLDADAIDVSPSRPEQL